MRKWKKGFASIGLSAGLIAGAVLSPAAVFAETKSKIGISSISENKPQLKRKLESENKPLLSDDTLIIKYKTPITASEHKRLGTTLIKQMSGLNYAIVKVKDKKNLHKTISQYQKLDKVQSVGPSVLYKPLSFPDPKISEAYHLSMLQIDKAQKLAGKNKVKVAVIDQGIDSNHPELKGLLLPSYNTVNPMNPGSPDFHGTHVAGIIAAKKDNGIGAYGVNPNVSILPIDVFNRAWGAYDYAIAEGILQAVNSGAKVINMSLGGPMQSPVIEDAVKKALEKDVVLVAAAGNTGSDMISYPAAYEGVISVGSINKEKKLSYYSSFGPSVDLVAPGEDVYSTLYDYEKKSTFVNMSGTSMASPVVAGVASLLLSKYPNLTPAQVEYILEHTATDLGEKGFDLKYANGLVDPVKALQFDMKKLPTIIKKTLTKDEILKEAELVDASEPVLITGDMTKPYEEKWIKFNVNKGEYIQAVLEGSPLYDYKMMIHFYSPEGDLLLDVNKVRENKAEGKLVKAPFTGTVAIGVKDANGSYDDSGKKTSQYTLKVEKAKELPEDESSIQNPIKADKLPFETKDLPLTFTGGEEGDHDYVTFKVEEEQVVKIDASGVPGIDSNISVYPSEMLFPPDMEKMAEEEKAALAAEMIEGKEPIDPMYYANSKGIGEGETLSFVAYPGEYIVKVSNKSSYYWGMYEFFFNFDMFSETTEAEPSLLPYSVQIQGKVLPPDEDVFPYIGDQATEEIKVEIKTSSLEQQRNIISTAYEDPKDPIENPEDPTEDPTEDPMEEFYKMLQEQAPPYEIGSSASGYLQRFEDEDWFIIKPEETGIYEFQLLSKDLPMMEVYQLGKDKDKDGKEITYLNNIGGNVSWNWDVTLEKSFFTGMKKDETYFIKLNADYINGGHISFDPYEFTSKLIVNNPQDKYEDNDKFEDVKDLPGTVIRGNFAMPNDKDVFYLQSRSEQIYGVTIERGELTPELQKYPKELTANFYSYMVVIEDINKNRKVDEEEYNYLHFIDNGVWNGSTYGSFKAGKGKNYILITEGFFESNVPLSLRPYQLTVASVNKKDEDAGNKISNNKPTKPIILKQNGNLWEAEGYLNAGVPYGDEDWYEFTLKKDASGKIKLETGMEVDGKIDLYQNGKLISSADFYAAGDDEVLNISLKKGTYHIKVSDYYRNSSINPYKIKVYMK